MSNPALLLAAQSGDVDTVNALVTPSNINLADENGISALHAAAIGNQLGIVELLLARGADVSHRTANGRTVLHNACARSSTAIVSILLDAGSQLDDVAPSGGADGGTLSALDFALDWNRQETVELLRSRGAKSASSRA